MTSEQQQDNGTEPESFPQGEAGEVNGNAVKPGRRLLRRLLLVLGPAVALGIGGYVYVTGGRYIETENAYVKADKVSVSAQISGPITEVLVQENEHVKRGQPLFRIDDSEYRIAMARAKARLQGIRSLVQGLKSSYRQKQQELALAKTNAAFADREYKRQLKLAHDNLNSQSKLDEARHNLDVARRRIAINREALEQLKAQLGGDPDTVIANHPLYQEAKAAYSTALLNLDHTTVRAPYAGVAQEKPEPGQYVVAGKPVMAVVADKGMWVRANYKETELTHVHPGQQVTIHIDTYPGRTWQGTVASLSQASGAEFSVLPPQNATGNWVKVVQRIPVRIAIHTEPGTPQIRAGMSTTVSIDTGYHRPLPGFVRTALNWLEGAPAPAAAAEARGDH
ncbi:MAG: HlyD family secretion protein [Gammaproteobacteria bacterium]|jgi:membrane fusion protein (multidrug efflux system)